MHYFLTFCLLFLFLSTPHAKTLSLNDVEKFVFLPPVHQEIKSKEALPFVVSVAKVNGSLGFEIKLAMNTGLRTAGVYDIKLAAFFPFCSNLFNYHVDLTDWPSGKKHLTEVPIEFPKLCVSDLGLQIPFTTLCLSIVDLFIMQRGVSGRIRVDMSIGVSTYQWVASNLTLYEFELGQIEPCIVHKTSELCRRDNRCGWCNSRNQCLTSRQDRKSDLCKVCTSCSWFSQATGTSESECMSKNSCGWCDQTKTCQAGDELGPFDVKSKCKAVELVDWKFATRSDDKKEGALAGALTMTGLVIGLTVFLGGILFGAAIVALIVRKKTGYTQV